MFKINSSICLEQNREKSFPFFSRPLCQKAYAEKLMPWSFDPFPLRWSNITLSRKAYLLQKTYLKKFYSTKHMPNSVIIKMYAKIVIPKAYVKRMYAKKVLAKVIIQ